MDNEEIDFLMAAAFGALIVIFFGALLALIFVCRKQYQRKNYWSRFNNDTETQRYIPNILYIEKYISI